MPSIYYLLITYVSDVFPIKLPFYQVLLSNKKIVFNLFCMSFPILPQFLQLFPMHRRCPWNFPATTFYRIQSAAEIRCLPELQAPLEIVNSHEVPFLICAVASVYMGFMLAHRPPVHGIFF